jgi:hypothetical protein
MLRYFLLILLGLFFSLTQIWGLYADNLKDDINVRDIEIRSTGQTNTLLEEFQWPISEFFFSAPTKGWDWLNLAFINIAFQIKNFFIGIALIFLIIGVLKLLFSPAGDEDMKKWKSNIIWVSVGVFIMQIAFSVWKTLILTDINDNVGGWLGYQFWINIFEPIVNIMQMLAAFGFMLMMLYAFYIIVAGWGDEEKLKKWKNIVIYALIGFFLIKLPKSIIETIYWSVSNQCKNAISVATCEMESQKLSWAVEIIGKIFNFFNTFLTILCVILVIYAGWLVLISWGDEEKLKKAKHIILYIIVWFVILVSSHAIFRFFILKG